MGVLWNRTLMGDQYRIQYSSNSFHTLDSLGDSIQFSIIFVPFAFCRFLYPGDSGQVFHRSVGFPCQKLEDCLSSLGVGVVTQFQIMRFSCFSAQVQGAHRGSEGASNAVMSALFLLEEEVINLISLDRNNEVVYTFVYFHFQNSVNKDLFDPKKKKNN